uniref:Uncharacterized protein n=1 Tax=Pipistrellus kuhlii TaxID=59472 RepID=A0A7J7X0A7_PIPKU|nr:hypothetical protein mPipKuh1_010816 [Pipistrellus kuhlii]
MGGQGWFGFPLLMTFDLCFPTARPLHPLWPGTDRGRGGHHCSPGRQAGQTEALTPASSRETALIEWTACPDPVRGWGSGSRGAGKREVAGAGPRARGVIAERYARAHSQVERGLPACLALLGAAEGAGRAPGGDGLKHSWAPSSRL